MNPVNTLLIILGTLSLAVGVMGIFIPGLPTTPFLLITAGLYLRGSKKLYQRLISNKIIGSYIRDYQAARGMTLKQKYSSIGLMWFMIIISCIFFIPSLSARITVLAVGVTGTLVMGWLVPTSDRNRHQP